MSSACKTAIKYSLPKSTLPILFEEDGAPSNIKLSCCCCLHQIIPSLGKAMLSISTHPVWLDFILLSFSVRSHVLSSPCQTSNILHLGSSRCSVFRTMSFVASKFALPCCLMGCVRLPTSLSSQIRRLWMTCSSFTPVTSTTLRHFHQPKLT